MTDASKQEDVTQDASGCRCGHPRVEHDYGRGECYLWGCKCRTFEQANTPTDDEREARLAAEERYPTIRPYDHEPAYPRSALRHYMQGAFISGWKAGRAALRAAADAGQEEKR